MNPLASSERGREDVAVENWDDDGDFQGFEDLHFRNVSTTTASSFRRDSTSSRMSTRSDRDSCGGGDEDWQVLLPDGEERLTADAISSAKTAGIPIPQNVPASALLGGTIKRLGGRKVKKMLGDDWGEDIVMPKSGEGGLKLKRFEAGQFPDSLVGFINGDSPASPLLLPTTNLLNPFNTSSDTRIDAVQLQRFKDDDDDEFFDVPTIKVAKNRQPQKLSNILPPQPNKQRNIDDMEADLELPKDGQPLKLSVRKDEPKTPATNLTDDFDLDWAEGSLGTRFGGTRRDIRSNPSSSVSAFSPSASSCLTAESEDDGLEGLVLPHGNFKFDEALKKRMVNANKDDSPTAFSQGLEKASKEKLSTKKDDFFSGLDIGDGDVFDSGKLTLNRNIKHKATKQTSPTRRPATTLTFTNKLEPSASKIPRYQFHDRQRSTLESVSESGPAPQYKRSVSRLAGHSPQSSVSAIPTPSTPSRSGAPSTPSRKSQASKPTHDFTRPHNTTHPANYLKAKRSLPAMSRNQPSPARQPAYQRPPSRGPSIPSRPKTPVDRSGAESSMSNARKPFLPAGTPHAHSHHISAKNSKHSQRPNSSDSNETAPLNRPLSRLSHFARTNANRSTSPPKARHAPDSLVKEASSKRTITKPVRRRAFGDGNELDVFDDLPTSASNESKYTKQPIARGAPKSTHMRTKLGLQHNIVSSSSVADQAPTPKISSPLSPHRKESVPRFARDTNASRLAREQRIGSVSATLQNPPPLSAIREASNLSSLRTDWKATSHVSNRNLASPVVSKKRSKAPPQKPRLIKPLGDIHANPKEDKGMMWNPELFRWEGNENALAPFDVPSASPKSTPKSPGTSAAKAAPALIANVGASKGVQMNGNMIFDPQRMCWLKATAPGRTSTGSDANALSPQTNADDEEDPFADIEDLDDKPKSSSQKQAQHASFEDVFGPPLSTTDDSKDDMEPLVIGEEFDVGPEFAKRLRAEEERWRTKVAGWIGEGISRDDDDGRSWKYAIRAKTMAGTED